MHAIRHLLGKARLSEMEVKVLVGLARQIRWYVAQDRDRPGLGGNLMNRLVIVLVGSLFGGRMRRAGDEPLAGRLRQPGS